MQRNAPSLTTSVYPPAFLALTALLNDDFARHLSEDKAEAKDGFLNEMDSAGEAQALSNAFGRLDPNPSSSGPLKKRLQEITDEVVRNGWAKEFVA